MLLQSLKAKARTRNKFKQRSSVLKSVLPPNASLPRKLRRALKHPHRKARARRLSSPQRSLLNSQSQLSSKMN